jgi:hypothetical protein
LMFLLGYVNLTKTGYYQTKTYGKLCCEYSYVVSILIHVYTSKRDSEKILIILLIRIILLIQILTFIDILNEKVFEHIPCTCSAPMVYFKVEV